MFSLDNVIDDLWPQARPAPWQKKLLKKLFYEEEFQQFADRHRHLKGLDTVEQVLEYLNIRCAIPAHDLEQIPEYGPLVIIANHPTGTLDGLALLLEMTRLDGLVLPAMVTGIAAHLAAGALGDRPIYEALATRAQRATRAVEESVEGRSAAAAGDVPP